MITKIDLFERNDKKVYFIGVSHIGTKEYYANIQKLLDKATDGVVLFEGIKNMNIDLHSVYRKLAEISDLIMQKDALVYSDKWVRSDVTSEQMEIYNGGEIDTLNIISDAGDSLDELYEISKDLTKRTILLLLKMLPLIKLFKKTNKAITKFRDTALFVDIIDKLVSNDVVYVLYGDDHRKNLRKTFDGIGFYCNTELSLNPLSSDVL